MFGGQASNAAFALSAAVDVAVVASLAAWSVKGGVSGWRVAAAAVLATATLAVKGLAMIGEGLHVPFGVAHVLWLDAVVVLPLAAVVVGVLAWRSGGLLLRLAVVAGVLLAPVGAYASLVEPERLVVEDQEIDVPPERTGDDPVRVALIADIQFEELGDHEREAVDRVLAERPDLILLAGDYHQGTRTSFERQLPAIRALLSRLQAPGGVFAVQGDAESLRKARAVLAGTGIRLLEDETVHTRVGDREISIGGLRLRYWSASALKAARRLERQPGTNDVRLLLSHRPDPVLRLARDSRIDLVLAGHTHGGQIQLPLLGPLETASHVSRSVGAGGLHTVRANRIYVSRGIGVERGQAPRVRLGAPPEVSILELR